MFAVQNINKVIRDVKTKVQGLADEKEQILGEHQDLVKRRAKLELDIKDLQEEIDGDKSAKVSSRCCSSSHWCLQ